MPIRNDIIDAFTRQIGWCDRLGSPFTARVLDAARADLQTGGPLAGILADWPGNPVDDALALRVAGSLHALVLSGDDPALAACYPPHPTDLSVLSTAIPAALARHAAFIARFVTSPPQTNEVARSAVLLGGFITIAAATRLPLRMLELGASAGLNRLWDRFSYRLGEFSWGDPVSPVQLAPAWTGDPPPRPSNLRIASRASCDIAPVDIADPAARLRLAAYIWPDQAPRLARLAGALTLAGQSGLTVQRADAADWLRAALATPAEGQATIVYHSIFWQYMPEATRADIEAQFAEAGGRASPTAPLAWLRFEPENATAAPHLSLTLWPGGATHRLASADAHGRAVTWLGLPDVLTSA